jgi:hypothetical protein
MSSAACVYMQGLMEGVTIIFACELSEFVVATPIYMPLVFQDRKEGDMPLGESS